MQLPNTLFIADLHLSIHEPAITAGFLRFLQQSTQTEALYILGDLFETWIGDDDPQPLHQTVAQNLLRLKQQGVPCYFIHGNRDFLIGQHFASQSGMILLPELYLLDLYGQKTLILHGDTLCSDDLAYQRFRRWTHYPWMQRLFLHLPLAQRLKIADILRNRSQISNQNKSNTLMDVNQQTVEATLQSYGVKHLIHGHTHRPAIHRFDYQGQIAQRAVLGAWHQQGSVLEVSPAGYQLIDIPLT